MTTMTNTAAEKRSEAAQALKVLSEYIGLDTPIYCRTDYGKGLTDYVRVYVVGPDSEIHDLTYYVSRACGINMSDRGLKLGGGGYSKGLDVFISIRRTLNQPLDQSFMAPPVLTSDLAALVKEGGGLVTAGHLAKQWGVSRNAAMFWTQDPKYRFPKPVAVTAFGDREYRLYLRSEVERWKEQHEARKARRRRAIA